MTDTLQNALNFLSSSPNGSAVSVLITIAIGLIVRMIERRNLINKNKK